MRRLSKATRALWLCTCLSTAGCAVGPNYTRPSAPVPVAYKELKGWIASRPSDDLPKGAWWTVFHDPTLDRLEPLVQVNNQNVIASLAAYREAQAIVNEARSGLFPVVSANGSLTRASGHPPSTNLVEEFQASWAPDLWGKIRRAVASDVAAAQASAADLQNATLSAQAVLAVDYFELRQSDSLQSLLKSTVSQYQRSLKIAQNQYEAGTVPRSDVLTAQTQLLGARAQLINAGVARAQYEHAIAVLVGRPPAQLSLPHGALSAFIPRPPVGLPSTLLERRPDIAAAERRVKQQNELIGFSVAGYFPNLTLSALAGAAGDPFSAAASAANLVWSLGAAGSATIFNGFLTKSQVEAAQQAYLASVAAYRQTTLAAFQQVEDDLSTSQILARQAVAEEMAVRAAQQSVAIALNEYQAGTQAYTAVVTAQTAALSNEEAALSVRAQRKIAIVQLTEALGGGWSASSLPAD